jgi:hypothetical protein
VKVSKNAGIAPKHEWIPLVLRAPPLQDTERLTAAAVLTQMENGEITAGTVSA